MTRILEGEAPKLPDRVVQNAQPLQGGPFQKASWQPLKFVVIKVKGHKLGQLPEWPIQNAPDGVGGEVERLQVAHASEHPVVQRPEVVASQVQHIHRLPEAVEGPCFDGVDAVVAEIQGGNPPHLVQHAAVDDLQVVVGKRQVVQLQAPESLLPHVGDLVVVQGQGPEVLELGEHIMRDCH